MYELTTCSFIVKIWVEEPAGEMGHPTWRGHITHIPSGDRKYFEDLNEIIPFMNPYLQAIGIDAGSTPD